MSAFLGINHFSVERTGVSVDVPNNNLARLMYYLSCIFNVIEYNENNRLWLQKLLLFKWRWKKTVYALAVLFDHKIFFGAKIFVLDNGELTPDYGNDFLKITDERMSSCQPRNNDRRKIS